MYRNREIDPENCDFCGYTISDFQFRNPFKSFENSRFSLNLALPIFGILSNFRGFAICWFRSLKIHDLPISKRYAIHLFPKVTNFQKIRSIPISENTLGIYQFSKIRYLRFPKNRDLPICEKYAISQDTRFTDFQRFDIYDFWKLRDLPISQDRYLPISFL